MQLVLPDDQRAQLCDALRRAGSREIGGQLFGEQLAPSSYRLSTVTVQRRPGSFARFVVDLAQSVRDANRFFERTRHQYTRFNYIGEWHSHPQFAVAPSQTDRDTMQDLVGDRSFRGSFAVLMIARLNGESLLVGAWLFDPAGLELQVPVEVEHA